MNNHVKCKSDGCKIFVVPRYDAAHCQKEPKEAIGPENFFGGRRRPHINYVNLETLTDGMNEDKARWSQSVFEKQHNACEHSSLSGLFEQSQYLLLFVA